MKTSQSQSASHFSHFLSRISRLGMLMLCTVALASCQQKLTSQNLATVTNDMSPAEVEAILGEPTKVETNEVPLLSTTRYIYEKNEDKVMLVFVNDRLVSKSGKFGGDE